METNIVAEISLGRHRGEITKICEKSLRGDEYIHYLDCGDRFHSCIYVLKLFKLYTLNIYTLLYCQLQHNESFKKMKLS